MKIKIASIIILISFLISCDNSLEMNVEDYESRLVVNCFFNPDDYWTVHVSRSLALLDPDIIIGFEGRPDVIESITNASVLLYENEQLIDSLKYSQVDSLFKLAYYISETYKPDISKKYKIKVSVPGFKSVYSEDIIPEYPEINSVIITDSININDTTETSIYNQWLYNLEINFRDKLHQANYYHIAVAYDPPGDTISAPQAFSSTDPVILADAAEASIFGSRIVARGQYVNEGEFAGFGAIFSDKLFRDQNYALKIGKIFAEDHRGTDNLRVRLTSLSESCYKYLLNISQKINAEIEQNPFAEPIIIYTNVNNGAGIFAGYSTAKIPQNQWIKNLK